MDYQQWNGAITRWFFREDMAGVPVYLAVDDDVLREIADGEGWPPGEAVASFEAAARCRLHGPEPFDPLLRETAQWRVAGGHGDPPFVVALAVAVLAAARMQPAASGSGSYSYYRPLREILELPGRGMPAGYDNAMAVLWERLNWWLRERLGGGRGLPTAATRRSDDNIGWALSQAVVRGSDRARLGLFFRAIGAQPGDAMAGPELLKRFQEWCRLSARAGDRLRSAASSPALAPVLEGVLEHELARFDGAARDGSGRRCLPLVLTTADDGGAPFGLAVEVPPELQGRTLAVDGAGDVALPPGQPWVRLPAEVAAAGPSASVDASVGRYRFVLPHRDCWVFQVNDVIGCWAGVDVAEVGVEHRVLVRAERRRDAETVMSACGGDPVAARRARVPPGWLAFARYRPAGAATPMPGVAELCPRAHQVVDLVGGLCLSRSDHLWLVDFPPELVVPSVVGDPPRVTVDGAERPPLRRDGGLALDLAGLRLGAGEHEVVVGSRRLTVKLVERLRETTPPARIALPVRGDAGTRWVGAVPVEASAEACAWLSGARLSDAVERRVRPRTLVRQSSRVYVLGPVGCAAQVHPRTPRWIGEHGLCPADFDLEPALLGVPFGTTWVMAWLQSHRRVRHVAGAQPAAGPRPQPPTLLSHDEWARLVSSDGPPVHVDGSDDDARLWAQYAQAG